MRWKVDEKYRKRHTLRPHDARQTVAKDSTTAKARYERPGIEEISFGEISESASNTPQTMKKQDSNLRDLVKRVKNNNLAVPIAAHTLLATASLRDIQQTLMVFQQFDNLLNDKTGARNAPRLHLYNSVKQMLGGPEHKKFWWSHQDYDDEYFGEEKNIPKQFWNDITEPNAQKLSDAALTCESLALKLNPFFVEQTAKLMDKRSAERPEAFDELNYAIWHGDYPGKKEDVLKNPQKFIAESYNAMSLALGCVGTHISILKRQMAQRPELQTNENRQQIQMADAVYKKTCNVMDQVYGSLNSSKKNTALDKMQQLRSLNASNGSLAPELRKPVEDWHEEGERPPGELNSNFDENNEQPSSERLQPQDLRSQQHSALANTLIQKFQTQSSIPPQPSVEPALQYDRASGKESGSKASGISEMQGRLVIASNRVIDPNKPAAGGLTAAVGDMMYNINGLWFGSTNDTTGEQGLQIVRTRPFGRTTLAQVDLTEQQKKNYYAGFSNAVLWPIFHEEVKWADLNPAYFKSYAQVNKMFAAKLVPMLKDDDILWIHDYHLIPLAQELRALGCKQRIGFFNHIPLPPPDVIKQIPQHKQLMEALFSYDFVGMQTAVHVENFHRYVEMEGDGQPLEGSLVKAFGKKTSVEDCPIGIDVESFRALVPSTRSQAILDQVRNEAGKRLVMIGAERLDYTKGVPQRLEGFHELLETNPEMHNRVTLVQIAPTTRQEVPAYAELIKETKELVDGINDKFGTDTWKPVIYLNEFVERSALPEIYRLSRVGVVTPVADGMNLVAKEYIAAQSSEDPGVLVLSTGAGAASQLPEALLVPPRNNRGAIANAYYQALTMSLDERKRRFDALFGNVNIYDLSGWRVKNLSKLLSVPRSSTIGDERIVTEDAATANREEAP